MGEMTVIEPETPTKPSQTTKRRKFDTDDMLAMIQLIAKGCTDTESCNLLGFKPESWMNWKCKPRNKVRFDEALHEAKGRIIVTCIDGIEKAGLRDWRALRERLALLDQRFNDRAQQPVVAALDAYAQFGLDMAKLLAEGAQKAKVKAVVDVEQVKMIGPAKE